jgi:hypothetical protein
MPGVIRCAQCDGPGQRGVADGNNRDICVDCMDANFEAYLSACRSSVPPVTPSFQGLVSHSTKGVAER